MSMLPALLLALLPVQETTATAELSATSVEVGGTVEVRVSLDITAGWHVYHPDQDETLGIPVSIRVRGEDLAPGALESPAPIPHTEVIGTQMLEYLWLEGQPEFTLPLTVSGVAGTRELDVVVAYQMCDDSSCLAPDELSVPLTLEVTGGAQAPAPQEFQADRVQVSAGFDRASVASGGTAKLRVTYLVEPGWHLYHPDQDPQLGLPVSVRVDGEELSLGELSAPGPIPHIEMIGTQMLEYLWVDGEVVLELPVSFGGEAGAREVLVTAAWQACDDSSCLQAEEHAFALTMDVTGEAVAVAAGGAGAPGAAADVGAGEAAAQQGGPVPPHADELELSALPPQVVPSIAGAKGVLEEGEEIDLVFRLDIVDDWHVYHPDQDPDFGIPVSVELLGTGLELVGGLSSVDEPVPHTETIGDMKLEYLWLSGAPHFVQTVRVVGPVDDVNARAVLRWQACDDQSCLSPTAYGFPLDRITLNGYILAQGEIAGLIGEGFWAFLVAAALAGLFTLATPCVFPMIPITISFFTKRSEAGKGSALGNAAAYGGGIVLTFVGLGLGAAALLGAGGANDIASNPWLNIALAGLFVFFAFSLLGFYEINAPKWMQNMASKTQSEGQNKSGYMPVVLMAVAFSVTAFTCTVGFVGGLLALAASTGSWVYALAGMTVYAIVFATPFFLLALFPSMVKNLPQAGGWMNAVKVTLGYVELIAAWKFLSNADRFLDWQILTRPVVIALTAIPLALASLYLFGLYRTKHDFEKPKAGPVRMGVGVAFAAMTVFVLLGFRGGPYAGAAEAYFPPITYGSNEKTDAGLKLGPADLGWHDSYPEAFAAAQENERILFLDFTGVTCVNCLRMEGNIFPTEQVKPLLETMERAELYVDKPPHGPFNKKLQFERFNSSQQPQYVLIDPRDDTVLGIFNGYKPDPALFAAFLQDGIDTYASREFGTGASAAPTSLRVDD